MVGVANLLSTQGFSIIGNMRYSIRTYHFVEIRLLIGAASRLEPCALDLRPDHALAEERFSTKEEFVVVSPTVLADGEAVEPVKVQLPLKAG